MRRYSTLGLAAGALVILLPSGASAQWGRPPVPRVGACFYQDANFRGQYFCAPVGATVTQVPLEANDQISSIRILGNAEVTVFKDADFRGSSRRFDSDVYDLDRDGFNDRVSSYRIDSPGHGYGGNGNWGGAYGGGAYGGHYDGGSYGGGGLGGWSPSWGYERPPDSGACFYQNPNYGGKYFCSRLGAVVTQVPGGSNDRISSIRLFGNTSVTVYADRGFSGLSRRFDYDMRDLRREGWNDTISSFRVAARGYGHKSGNWGGGAYGGGSYGGGSWGGGHTYSAGRVSYQEAQRIVARAYRSVLGRDPDPGSSGYVTRVMNGQMSESQVEAELRRSPEYKQKHGR